MLHSANVLTSAEQDSCLILQTNVTYCFVLIVQLTTALQQAKLLNIRVVFDASLRHVLVARTSTASQ